MSRTTNATNDTEAGTGDHHFFLLPGGDGPLVPNEHYLGIDAASWFINKQSSFFSDWSASGTVEISLVDDRERYSIALGSFELEQGARTAPVFNKALVPDRQFRGGAIGITVALSFYRRDSRTAALLRGAAAASLNIASGMVETATLAGPALVLAAAGAELVRGVRGALHEAGQQHHLFGGGLSVGLRAEHVRGERTYLLLHRGGWLDETKLEVQRVGGFEVPSYDGRPLEDGAWVLLVLRRGATYPGERPWAEEAKAVRGDVENLVRDVLDEVQANAAGMAQLFPGEGGAAETLFDRFVALRRVIQNDAVLAEAEARQRVRELGAVFREARDKLTAAPQKGASPSPVLGARGAAARSEVPVEAELRAFEAARAQARPALAAVTEQAVHMEVIEP